MPKTAAIVIIGDEILAGKFPEENAALLIGELRALGVDLRRVTIIPDAPEDIAATVVSVSQQFDVVFTSGGVGPTHDDITMSAIAAGFDTDVHRHPVLEDILRRYWGEQLAPANLRLADVPRGCDLVYGKDKDWPVVRFRNVYILPGVPALFKRKFLSIRDHFRHTPLCEQRLYCRADEGALAPALAATHHAFPNVAIGSYPRYGETDFQVIVTLESRSKDELQQATAELRAALGSLIVNE